MRNKTIQFKIMAYNICVICLIGAIFSITSYVTAYQKVVLVAENSVAYHVKSISSYYREAYEKMVNLVLNCGERNMVELKTLGKLETVAEKKKGLEYSRLVNNFCAVTGYDGYISKLCVFGEEDIYISAGYAYSSVDDARRIRRAPWFARELDKGRYAYKLDLVESPFYREEEQLLPVVMENGGYGAREWTALFLSPKLYQDKLEQDSNGNSVIVSTHEGQWIAAVGIAASGEGYKELIAELLESGKGEGEFERVIGQQKCFVSYSQDARSGILVAEIMDMGALKSDSMLLLQTVALIFLACAGLGITLTFLFGKVVRKPIARLVKHVEHMAEGSLSPDAALESPDEIGTIGKAINAMGGEIERLMERRLEDEKEKSRLEIQMLQAQINPHFLYNTLDSIKWIAVIQKNSGIVKAVTSLSKLMKNMAKGVNQRITLREELDLVNDYVTIEKLKYAEMFDFQVEAHREELYGARIVKLTLQPLVENAIFSGIEPSGKSGTIRIRIREKDQCLYVSVEDDGIGIDPETLPTLLDNTEKLKGDRMSSIGMPNVDRRLKLIYGEEFGLLVESCQEGTGEDCEWRRGFTKVTVKIPLEF